MAGQQLKNLAYSTLSAGITSGDTTASVQSGHGARFPSAGNFYCLLDDGTNQEIVLVTARSTDALTITRAQGGTSASAFASGASIKLVLTAESLISLIPVVTGLPGSPIDGQECIYRVSDSVGWHLKYDAAISDSYKWRVIGGGPLYYEVAGSVTNNGTGGGGVEVEQSAALTLPLAGFYDFDFGARIQETVAAITCAMGILPSAGTIPQLFAYKAGDDSIQGVRQRSRTTVAHTAGTTIDERSYRSNTGATTTIDERYISAMPVRVG